MITCEVSYSSKNKEGETICGDTISIKRNAEREVISVSDGLGSGVKASILSTLTASMASTMVFNKVPIDEVFSSILSTLPVCKVRGISYATLCTALVDYKKKRCSIIEYEFPVVLFFRGHECIELKKAKRVIEGKEIYISNTEIREDDSLFVMTDGISQAGMGIPHFPFGLGLNNIKTELLHLLKNKVSHQEIVNYIVNLANRLDQGTRGDDALAAGLYFRELRVANVLVGPPEKPESDRSFVQKFMGLYGKKVVCGGTTGQIVEKVLGKTIDIDIFSITEKSPPIGYLEGIDLITEGIITLTHVYRYLENQDKEPGYGAKLLLNILEESDRINFIVGRAINPAHQNPLFSHDISLKFRLIRDISAILEKKGKLVNIEYY
jgi:hypothetical protein